MLLFKYRVSIFCDKNMRNNKWFVEKKEDDKFIETSSINSIIVKGKVKVCVQFINREMLIGSL